MSGKKRRSGAHSKKTLFIGRSFIKSIDRSVEKSNNSIIDHLVCQAKLLLQYYQDFYSIWKSRSRERERWTTLEECNWRRTFVCTKMLPAPPTSRKMAKLLCSHIEPYILEQVMIYSRILLKTECNKMWKFTEAEVPWEPLRYGASSEICTINHIIWIYGGFQKLLLCVI